MLIKKAVKAAVRRFGYELIPAVRAPRQQPEPGLKAFKYHGRAIAARHEQQSAETVAALNTKYESPVFGEMRVWDLIQRLAFCIDPIDTRLLNTSQYVHVLQIIDAMEQDNVKEPHWYVAAMLHDLGKLLLLKGEAPENVVCMNAPIGECERGAGLDQVVMQWNHDEYAYMRLKNHVSDEMAWLIRYHSINLTRCEPFMDERDREYRDKYLLTFRKYDFRSKSPFHHPAPDMEKYRQLVEEAIPEPIFF